MSSARLKRRALAKLCVGAIARAEWPVQLIAAGAFCDRKRTTLTEDDQSDGSVTEPANDCDYLTAGALQR
jgi:hypothetical protein